MYRSARSSCLQSFSLVLKFCPVVYLGALTNISLDLIDINSSVPTVLRPFTSALTRIHQTSFSTRDEGTSNTQPLVQDYNVRCPVIVNPKPHG